MLLRYWTKPGESVRMDSKGIRLMRMDYNTR